MNTATPTTIDEYIALFPAEVQALLEQVRQTIRETAPEAEEAISYGMPAFRLNGPLVYFAGFKNHIGFYPTPVGLAAFQKDLAPFKTGKGSVQFPIQEALPLELIRKIVAYRLQLVQSKVKKK